MALGLRVCERNLNGRVFRQAHGSEVCFFMAGCSGRFTALRYVFVWCGFGEVLRGERFRIAG